MQQGESPYAETALAIYAAARRMNQGLYKDWGYSSKEAQSFRYFDSVILALRELL